MSAARHPFLLAREAPPRPAWWPGRGAALVLVGGLVVMALGLSVLRNQIIELRYRTAELLRVERGLEENRRALTVRVRRLRDPRRLAGLARERGFARPERVILLDRSPGAPAR